jgi:hypothetical protein
MESLKPNPAAGERSGSTSDIANRLYELFCDYTLTSVAPNCSR